MAELLEAELAAERLQHTLEAILAQRKAAAAPQGGSAAGSAASASLELLPHELERAQQSGRGLKPVRVLDLADLTTDEADLGQQDQQRDGPLQEALGHRFSLHFLDEQLGKQKRSKNFLKLVNQAARGFGRK